MSYFEENFEDIENRFLTNHEQVSLLAGLTIEADNLIEQTIDETNRGRLVALKKPLQNNNLIIQIK